MSTPHLDNAAGGLHPDNGSWRNFLKTKDLKEEHNGYKHYVSGNAHYIVLPDGEVLQYHGYHGNNAFSQIKENARGFLAGKAKAEREIADILGTLNRTEATPDSALSTVESSRSELSRASDERQSHSLTIEPDDPRTARWERDPGSMDVQGIDTPKRKGKYAVGKSKRKANKGFTSLGTTR